MHRSFDGATPAATGACRGLEEAVVKATLDTEPTAIGGTTATAAGQARARRFLEHCPPSLTDDLIALLRAWRAGRDTAGEVVVDLARRLRHALACPLEDESMREDLAELLGARGTHRRAAIELVGWACGEARV